MAVTQVLPFPEHPVHAALGLKNMSIPRCLPNIKQSFPSSSEDGGCITRDDILDGSSSDSVLVRQGKSNQIVTEKVRRTLVLAEWRESGLKVFPR